MRNVEQVNPIAWAARLWQNVSLVFFETLCFRCAWSANILKSSSGTEVIHSSFKALLTLSAGRD